MSSIAKQSAVLITWFHFFKKGACPQKSAYQLVGAPDPPVRRTNQNRLIGPSIVPNSQFPAAWKTQWHYASLIKFANFQIAIFRRELDR
jgi:hypothetical protein